MTTFLLEAAAAASVETLFPEKDTFSEKKTWPGDTGLLGRGRRRAGLLFRPALHHPRLSPSGEDGEEDWGGGG